MTVSVCIPTYNQAPYLEEAIRSAAEQSLAPLEIIVCDDCSTDETPTVLRKLATEFPALRIIRQPENVGIVKNTDTCLRLATGDFIIRLDSDDRLSPTYAKTLSDLLLTHPEAGYAHAAVQEIDQHGAFVRERKLFRKPGFQSSPDALKAAVKAFRTAANILMFRRSALVAVDYMVGRPNAAEDYHLTTAISAAGFGNVYAEEILSFYRVWVNVERVKQRRKLMEVNGLRRVFEDVLEPAFSQRGWSLAPLKASRTSFACQHADCLSWSVHGVAERNELATELRALSSAPSVQFYIWLYSNGFEKILDPYYRLRSQSVTWLKLFLLRLKT